MALLTGMGRPATYGYGTPGDDESSSDDSSSDVNGGMLVSHAKPQLLDGREVWPEHWGISHLQIRELLARLRRDPSWKAENDVYCLVEDFIIPWTHGSGLGYALLLNRDAPLECNVMVSHAFSENAEEFLETLLRATSESDVIYVCCLANYQAEDGIGPTVSEQLGQDPSESPFKRVLQHLKTRSQLAGGWTWRHDFLSFLPTYLLCATMLSVHSLQSLYANSSMKDPLQGSRALTVAWYLLLALCCLLLAAAIWAHMWMRRRQFAYSCRMLVVPNRNIDIYTRLWCVFEIFVAIRLRLRIELAPSFVPAGEVSCQTATCSFERDLWHLRSEIEGLGYSRIDSAIKQMMRLTRWHTFGVFWKYVVLQVLPLCLAFRLWNYNGASAPFFMLAFVLICENALVIGICYSIARSNKGIVHTSARTIHLCTLYILFFTVFVSVTSSNCFEKAFFPKWDIQEWVVTGAWVLGYEIECLCVVLLASHIRPFPACLLARNRIVMLLSWFAFVYLWQVVVLFIHRCLREMPWDGSYFIYSFDQSWAAAMPLYLWWTESLRFGIQASGSKRNLGRMANLAAWTGLCVYVITYVPGDMLDVFFCFEYRYTRSVVV